MCWRTRYTQRESVGSPSGVSVCACKVPRPAWHLLFWLFVCVLVCFVVCLRHRKSEMRPSSRSGGSLRCNQEINLEFSWCTACAWLDALSFLFPAPSLVPNTTTSMSVVALSSIRSLRVLYQASLLSAAADVAHVRHKPLGALLDRVSL